MAARARIPRAFMIVALTWIFGSAAAAQTAQPQQPPVVQAAPTAQPQEAPPASPPESTPTAPPAPVQSAPAQPEPAQPAPAQPAPAPSTPAQTAPVPPATSQPAQPNRHGSTLSIEITSPLGRTGISGA